MSWHSNCALSVSVRGSKASLITVLEMISDHVSAFDQRGGEGVDWFFFLAISESKPTSLFSVDP